MGPPAESAPAASPPAGTTPPSPPAARRRGREIAILALVAALVLGLFAFVAAGPWDRWFHVEETPAPAPPGGRSEPPR